MSHFPGKNHVTSALRVVSLFGFVVTLGLLFVLTSKVLCSERAVETLPGIILGC